MKETAEQAADTARQILALFEMDRRTIERLGRAAASALRMHQFMQRKPIVSIEHMVRLGMQLFNRERKSIEADSSAAQAGHSPEKTFSPGMSS